MAVVHIDSMIKEVRLNNHRSNKAANRTAIPASVVYAAWKVLLRKKAMYNFSKDMPPYMPFNEHTVVYDILSHRDDRYSPQLNRKTWNVLHRRCTPTPESTLSHGGVPGDRNGQCVPSTSRY